MSKADPLVTSMWMKYLILAVLALVATELALHLLTWLSPAAERVLVAPWNRAATIPDDRLGVRGDPRWPDHDRWGFRNAAVPERVTVVAMGDSQTYGASVKGGAPWPVLLAERSGRQVYNMGLASYGPAHNLLNIERALSLEPDVVVYAFYFGNDLFDSFRLALTDDEIGAFLPADVTDRIRELEREDPLGPKAMRLYRRGGDARPPRSGFRTALSDRSMLYGLLRALKAAARPAPEPGLLARDFDQVADNIGPVEREFLSVFRGDEWRSILTAPYRGLVLDDSDPRIRAGVEVSKASIRAMHDRCTDRGSRFLALLLPTKENVFLARIADIDAHPGLREMTDGENRIRLELRDFMGSQGIDHVDLLEPLRSAESQPFPEGADGHLNPLGHEIVSRAIDLD